MAEVTVVTPVFGQESVFALLAKLRSTDFGESLRFVVIDNGNGRGLSERLSALRDERTTVIRFERNLGGSGAYRAGMTEAMKGGSDYVWLLDDDTEIDGRTLPALVAAHRRLEADGVRVGAVGSMTVDRDRGCRITELGANVSRISGCIRPNEAGADLGTIGEKTVEVDYVAACSLLVSRNALVEAGPFEQMFIHWDDIEWQLRMKRLGRRNFAVSGSVVRHPSAAAKRKDWTWYYDLRNSLRVVGRYFPWALVTAVFLKSGRMALYLLLGRVKAARMMFLGMRHAVTGRLLMRDELPL